MALQWLSPAVLNSCATYPAHDSKFVPHCPFRVLVPRFGAGRTFVPPGICVFFGTCSVTLAPKPLSESALEGMASLAGDLLPEG